MAMKKKSKRTLNVLEISARHLEVKWNTPVPMLWHAHRLVYVRCNSKGKVDWETTNAYLKYELKGRKHKVFHVEQVKSSKK